MEHVKVHTYASANRSLATNVSYACGGPDASAAAGSGAADADGTGAASFETLPNSTATLALAAGAGELVGSAAGLEWISMEISSVMIDVV